MAPTVCLSELPIVRSTTSPYSRRRQRVHNGTIGKQQRLELRQMLSVTSDGGTYPTPPESPLWDPEGSSDSCIPTVVSSSSPNTSARVPVDMNEHWRVLLARREDLLSIVVRTMALVRRNHILQERVNALRAETREFIRSVLNNPENKCRQQRLDASQDSKDEVVSSSTENVDTRPILPPTPDSTSSSTNDVSSTCCSSDWEDSDSSSDESQVSSCM